MVKLVFYSFSAIILSITNINTISAGLKNIVLLQVDAIKEINILTLFVNLK